MLHSAFYTTLNVAPPPPPPPPGEQYQHRQQEDVSRAQVNGLWISVGRRVIALDYAVAGQLVLVGGKWGCFLVVVVVVVVVVAGVHTGA
jgi:hypothetical protein